MISNNSWKERVHREFGEYIPLSQSYKESYEWLQRLRVEPFLFQNNYEYHQLFDEVCVYLKENLFLLELYSFDHDFLSLCDLIHLSKNINRNQDVLLRITSWRESVHFFQKTLALYPRLKESYNIFRVCPATSRIRVSLKGDQLQFTTTQTLPGDLHIFHKKKYRYMDGLKLISKLLPAFAVDRT